MMLIRTSKTFFFTRDDIVFYATSKKIHIVANDDLQKPGEAKNREDGSFNHHNV